MTGDMGAAIGDVVTGTLVSHAVDGGAGAHAATGTLCLNCGTRLIGSHCHACGQNGHVHRNLGAIGHELAHGVFHFEGKIWRTLPLLILRPGELTRRYIAGERVRFVSPLALFLFTVFLMFAAINLIGGSYKGDNLSTPKKRAATLAQLDRELVGARADVAQARARPGTSVASDKLRDAIARERTLQTARNAYAIGTNNKVEVYSKLGWKRLDQGIEKATDNPALAIYKLQSSAYKYSWALIPLSTPFVALLFVWRRRFGWYDHAIFVTYSLSFTMLLVIVLTLGAMAGLKDEAIVLPALLVPPVHMFAQLRGAYSLRKRSAAWRTLALLIFAALVLLGFFLALVVNGLTG